MRKLKLRGIAVVTALTIILTGCQAKQENNVSQEEHNTSVIEQVETTELTENVVVETTPEIKEETTYPTESPTTSETEEVITADESTQTIENFTFFEDAKNEIINYIESEEYQKIKEKGKYYITTGIDFIFFDQPINGIYFDQMTEELKKDVIRDVKSLDEAIMAYYPDYKEDISSKYQIAAEFVSEQYLNVMDAIKKYLGEENYNAVGEIKDQIKEDIGTKTEEGIGYIKDLYNNWKNK